MIVRKLSLLCAALWLLGGLCSVQAQRSTEQYIPIGQSPGVSGQAALIGEVVSASESAQTVTLKDQQGQTHTVHCDSMTHVWLDLSSAQRSNRPGTLADCRAGALIEIKLRDAADSASPADWIKVRPNNR